MGNEVSNCCGPTKQFGAMPNHAGEIPDMVHGTHLQGILSPRDHRMMLHRAAELGDVPRVRVLIKDVKVDVDVEDSKGNTALHKAAWHGHVEVCRLLVRHGADVDRINNVGKTPKLFAQQMGSKDVIDLLESVSALPDPAEVKRKFRKGVKTSNCAKIFGPRRSLTDTMGLIPGVAHEPEKNDEFFRTETSPAAPLAQPFPHASAQRTPLHDMPAADYDVNPAYSQPIRKVNLIKCPQLDIPAKSDVLDHNGDSFLSGRDTHRPGRAIPDWGDISTPRQQRLEAFPQNDLKFNQGYAGHYQQSPAYTHFGGFKNDMTAFQRATTGPTSLQARTPIQGHVHNPSVALV
mmetsp:Transcript_49197/g.76799  ORF Transcript_49197/g.76799 Transcript_49197/m.76799 type:complete len:347 (+) Transcript_49197:157-1197(+)